MHCSFSLFRAPAAGGQMVQGGIDFSQATRTPDGRLCVIKEAEVETVAKDPILECTHRNVEKCHYTYVTQFVPAQEEVTCSHALEFRYVKAHFNLKIFRLYSS